MNILKYLSSAEEFEQAKKTYNQWDCLPQIVISTYANNTNFCVYGFISDDIDNEFYLQVQSLNKDDTEIIKTVYFKLWEEDFLWNISKLIKNLIKE